MVDLDYVFLLNWIIFVYLLIVILTMTMPRERPCNQASPVVAELKRECRSGKWFPVNHHQPITALWLAQGKPGSTNTKQQTEATQHGYRACIKERWYRKRLLTVDNQKRNLPLVCLCFCPLIFTYFSQLGRLYFRPFSCSVGVWFCGVVFAGEVHVHASFSIQWLLIVTSI